MELFFSLGSVVEGLTVVSLLGGHANSQVFLARAQGGEFFAIKALRPGVFPEGAVKAYQREASLQISSKARYARVGSTSGVVYSVAPYLAGEGLDRLLARYPRVHSDLIREIIGQAAEIVGELHSYGVVHGALKPGNIFISAVDGFLSLFILDLGSRHLVSQGQEEVTIQLAGSALEYMSPEQADGQALTPKSDIFTLGVTLYQMLTGSVPFPGGVGYGSRNARPVRSLAPDADPELAALADRLIQPPVAGQSLGVADLIGIRRSEARTPEEEEATAHFASVQRSQVGAAEQVPPAEEPTATLASYSHNLAPGDASDDGGTLAISRQELSSFWPTVKPSGSGQTAMEPKQKPSSGTLPVAWTSEKKLVLANAVVAGIIILAIVVLAISG